MKRIIGFQSQLTRAFENIETLRSLQTRSTHNLDVIEMHPYKMHDFDSTQGPHGDYAVQMLARCRRYPGRSLLSRSIRMTSRPERESTSTNTSPSGQRLTCQLRSFSATSLPLAIRSPRSSLPHAPALSANRGSGITAYQYTHRWSSKC